MSPIYKPRQYLGEEVRRFAVTKFLVSDVPVGYFDGTRLTPPVQGPAMLLLSGSLGDEHYAAAMKALGPDAHLLRTGLSRPDSSESIYVVYGTGPDAQWLTGCPCRELHNLYS